MTGPVVIAGAGVLGAAIGWRLAQNGADVTLVDPTPGGVASPGSFAWLNASMAEDPVYNRLRHDSLLLWSDMKARDASVPVSFPGAILWEQDHFDLEAIAASHTVLGRDTRMLDRGEVAAQEPEVRMLPDRALFAATDGYGDPEAITAWFLDSARAAGATVLAGREITGIKVADGRLAGVKVGDDVLQAAHLIAAAGIRLPDLLSMVGQAMAMDNQAGLLARTTPGTGEIDAMLATPNVHIWQRTDGGYLIGADFGGGGGEVLDQDGETTRVLEALKGVLGGTDDCAVTDITVRQRPMPADGRPAIGPMGPEGLYVVSTHSGMTLAPVIGEMVAREIAEGDPDPRLAPYRPDRAALHV